MLQQVCVPVIVVFHLFCSAPFSSLFFCQVWAVGEDRGLYFRMGVTPSEPSGSGWIPVSAQWGNSKEVIPLRSVGITELNLLESCNEFDFFISPFLCSVHVCLTGMSVSLVAISLRPHKAQF